MYNAVKNKTVQIYPFINVIKSKKNNQKPSKITKTT